MNSAKQARRRPLPDVAGLRVAIVLGASAVAGLAAAGPMHTPAPAAPASSISHLAVPFVENAGQLDGQVRFHARTLGGTLFVTADGRLVYALPTARGESMVPDRQRTHMSRAETTRDAASGARPTLVESFAGGQVRVEGGAPSATAVSIMVGDAKHHRYGLATHESVELGEVYPGVDVRLRATGRNVEKIFTVRPGGDPAAIRMRIDGADRLDVDATGALVASTTAGAVSFTPPVAWQDVDGLRQTVEVRYAARGPAEYGFVIGTHDRSLPLVIDPLLQSTFLGGSDDDLITAMAIHPLTGDVYVAGFTTSIDFPCTVSGNGCANGAQTALHGFPERDGFIARLDAGLTTLLQATYVGGTKEDTLSAIAIHPVTGDVYAAGTSFSLDFPLCAPAQFCAVPAQSSHAQDVNQADGIVLRFNAGLTSLILATYLGGNDADVLTGLAIHPVNGDLYVAGYTSSGNFPCTNAATGCANGAQIACNACSLTKPDGVVARLTPTLTSVVQATYVGGPNYDRLTSIAIHPWSGEVYVGGETESGFPCTASGGTCANGAQPAYAGGTQDAVVARLSEDLRTLVQATYFGGTNVDTLHGLAIHPATGEIYAAGYTTGAIPCTTPGGGCGTGAQPASGGGTDGFVVRMSPTLTSFLQATYVGGGNGDYVMALAIHPFTGEVFAGMTTISSDFPCTGFLHGCLIGAQSGYGGNIDFAVVRFSADLTRRLQATYLGGTGDDELAALAIHPVSGQVYVAGTSDGATFPCVTSATPGCATGARAANGGGLDGVVARISSDLTVADTTPGRFDFTPQFDVPPRSLRTSNPVALTSFTTSIPIYVDGGSGSAYCVSSAADCSCDVLPFGTGQSTITAGRYVCARHVAAAGLNLMTRTVVHAGGAAGVFATTTGNALGGLCTLDVDGNGAVDALTDGLLILRAMMGMTGTAVTVNAIGNGATRLDWLAVRAFLNGSCGTSFAP